MPYLEQCPLCGGRRLAPFAMASGVALLHNAQVRCADCALLISQPQATPSQIHDFYSRKFYEEVWPDPQATSPLVDYRRDELPLMKQLWASWPPPPRASVFEVGCGNGEMLELLRDEGYSVRGCDPGTKAVAHCRDKGFDVIEGTLPSLALTENQFDLVVCFQVIEHVPDPLAFTRALARIARPGGVIAVATEDAWTTQSACERLWRIAHGRIPEFRSPTDHTFVYQSHHLRRLFEQSGCDEIQTRSYTRPARRENLHWRLYKSLCRALDRRLGHGDYLMAVARTK